jgi:hypothetical protein
MVRIFHGEAMVGATVPTTNETLDDLTGNEFQRADAGKSFRVEEGAFGHFGEW